LKITVRAVGKIRPPFSEAEAHYLKMLRSKQSLEVVEAKDDAALIRRIDRESHLVALDIGGEEMTSEGWAAWLDRRRRAGRKVEILIGGPEGLPAAERQAAQEKLALGPQTMAHQLARVVLLEQIFRASKILARENYHL
jgi:23S rRNA (pseudouridine1915-N3)-methyltransferase